MPIPDIQARYGVVSFKALQSWGKIYREQGETGLRPKRKGRPPSAKNKPKKELTYVEEMELRIKRLKAELSIAKKLRPRRDEDIKQSRESQDYLFPLRAA